MTTELIINTYHFAIIGGTVIILAIVAFLLHNFGGMKLFIDKDKEITNKFLDKFPLVSPEFMNKSVKETLLPGEVHRSIVIQPRIGRSFRHRNR